MRTVAGDILRKASRPLDAGLFLRPPVRALLRGTLPLLIVASTLSGVAGYTYGVISAQHGTRASGSASVPDSSTSVPDPDVVVPPPSWRRWWPLTDF